MTNKISLIMPTIGNRDVEIVKFLTSLSRQNYQNYELIIVDQSSNSNLEKILCNFKDKIAKIHYVKSNSVGASRARNEGLKYSRGDIVAFPDDDCEYADNVLEVIAKIFTTTNYDVITGKHVDKWPQIFSKKLSFLPLNIYNIWWYGIEFVIFLRKKVVDTVGLFDEDLGVGSGTSLGSGEGTDYLLRIINYNVNEFKLANCSAIVIKHEKVDFDKPDINKKAFKYSIGRRYLLDKYNYSFFFVLLNIWYPVLKLVINIYDFKKVKYYWYQFLGRLKFFRNVELFK